MTDSIATDAIVSRVIGILKQLVAFDSVSRHSNLPIIGYIEDYLDGHYIPYTSIPSPDGRKSNLLARIGPEAEDGVILSGHTDVVPVDGQDWSTPPFELTEKDSLLYGRGTADMKSFLAVTLAMAPEWSARTFGKPIYLAFSYDEEIGCLGAPYLLEHINAHIPKPALAIIGEPTMMQVVTAHKGVFSFETTVTGLEAHSSNPGHGVNAVHIACELVNQLSSIAADQAAHGRRDERFEPPHSTVHVGLIEGGTARNIIPRRCVFQWEIRPLPDEDAAAILARFSALCATLESRIKALSADASIVTRPMSRMSGVQLAPCAQEAQRLVMRCARSNRALAVSFGTEAGVFQAGGIPAIICGPGSIDQAHKPNECIPIAQIRECVAFMLRLADEWQTRG